jgi:hypothetical protein
VGGVIPVSRQDHGMLGMKFPWWRALPGNLTAWARPWKGGPTVRSQVATEDEYGPIGFVPSTLRFSKSGCWLITGSLDGQTLSFVARVAVKPL